MFPMRHEIAEKRIRKGIPAWKTLLPEDQRGVCIRCNGLAKVHNDSDVATRDCLECGFQWEVDGTTLRFYQKVTGFWREVPAGLMLVLWEKEMT